ncbi:MAG: hypothetical protein H6679_03985 [Epsilonproteobacteria bacterium]|nr:hypothetical protein [Campylobacterota bacterium]
MSGMKSIFFLAIFSYFFSAISGECFLDNVSVPERNMLARQDFSFYRDYLEKYFPKALVMQDMFLQMAPEQIEQSLEDLVTLFAKEPWFYFVNKPEGFKLGHYWEFIVDQLSIINSFLNKARINPLENKVFLLKDSFFLSSEEKLLMSISKPLLDYFKEQSNVYGAQKNMHDDFVQADEQAMFMALFDISSQDKTCGEDSGDEDTDEQQKDYEMRQDHVIFRFYALCFDYLIKLFNEGIMFKDTIMANKYQAELNYVMGKLRGSSFESDYQEALKTCRELYQLLELHLGVDKDEEEFINMLFGDDQEASEEAKALMRESRSLFG